MPDAFPAIYDVLAGLQVIRVGDIRSINRLNNAVGAYVRRTMGWSLALPEKDREKIRAKADRYVRTVMAEGTAPDGEDDALFPMLAPRIDVYRRALAPLIEDRARVEADMRKLARELTAWSGFGANVNGLGEMGLAVIVGECGDLANYDGPAKVWRRLGLAPYKGHAGKTWRIDSWRPRALTAEEWTEFGYSGRRRAEIYAVIGDPLFRAQTVAANAGKPAPYRAIYDARRARTAETQPEWSKAHSYNDALRIMTKALVRDLWCAWNGRAVKAY